MRITKALILLIILAVTQNFAQSDYEYVEKFKAEYKKIKSEIEKAETSEEIDKARGDVQSFEKKYFPRKDFLDKAIYPQSYGEILAELKSEIGKRKSEITELQKAKTKISELNREVRQLSENYISVLNDFENVKTELISEREKSRKYELALKRLRENIELRNKAISELLDSLFVVQNKKNGAGTESLNGETIRIKEYNVLRDVIVFVGDNIRYLNFAEPSSEELFASLKERKRLCENLKKINSNALAIILNDGETEKNLNEAKAVCKKWGEEIEAKIVEAISNDFAQFGVSLPDSVNFDAFYNSLLDYLEKESVKAGNRYEREHKFKTFSEALWNGIFKRKWLPGLLESGMMTNEQVETVNILLDNWEERAGKTPPYFLYIFVSVIVMLITIYVAAKAKKSKYKRKAIAQKKKNEYDKRKREKEIEEYKRKNLNKDN